MSNIYLLGESGIGKSYVRRKLDGWINTVDTPWSENMMELYDKNLSTVQIGFMASILARHNILNDTVIEGDPVSTLAFSLIAGDLGIINYRMSHVVENLFHEILSKIQKDGSFFIFFDRDRKVIEKYREERDRGVEYYKGSEKSKDVFDERIPEVSRKLLEEYDIPCFRFTLPEEITEETINEIKILITRAK